MRKSVVERFAYKVISFCGAKMQRSCEVSKLHAVSSATSVVSEFVEQLVVERKILNYDTDAISSLQ